MISGLRSVRRVLWNNESNVAELPSTPPKAHPEMALLRLLGAESFEDLEAGVEVRTSRGYFVGRLIESYSNGSLVDVRRAHYSSTLAAAIDERFVALETAVDDSTRAVEKIRLGTFAAGAFADAQAALDRATARLAEARRLAPVATRWSLLRDLDALADPVAPKLVGASPLVDSEADEEPELAAAASGQDVGLYATIGGLREQRREAEQRHREHLIERFERRQRAAAGHAAPDPDDGIAERVRIETRLREWDETNPGLAAALEAFSRARGAGT